MTAQKHIQNNSLRKPWALEEPAQPLKMNRDGNFDEEFESAFNIEGVQTIVRNKEVSLNCKFNDNQTSLCILGDRKWAIPSWPPVSNPNRKVTLKNCQSVQKRRFIHFTKSPNTYALKAINFIRQHLFGLYNFEENR